MRVCIMRICLVLLLSVSLSCSKATIENGGYNLFVAFSQNVPSDSGLELINQMKTSLEEASQVLHNAIGIQFSKVTFEIPGFWDTSQYENVEDHFNIDPEEEDILIDNTDDTVFGKFPFAQQYGSCGVEGDKIIVPTAFFNESNVFPKGISLAREWLKYRYGVFDENGYFGDPLYPLYYKIPGSDNNDVLITSCTNSEITYNITDLDGNECPSDKMLIDKLNAEECQLHLNDEDLENVTSSLMYFQETITNMKHICGKEDDHKHNSRSPNKQNILCYGKSIWDVVSQSSDIKNVQQKEHSEIEFVLTKQAKPRVVVAWENTKNLLSQGNIVLNAIRKLLIDLPDESKFIAFQFPLKENVNENYYTLKNLDEMQKKAISTDIKATFLKEDGNYTIAVEKAISILKAADGNSEEPPGHIIIITGTPDELVVVLLKNLKACIKSFDENSFREDIKSLTSNLPCLEVVRIPTSDKPEKVYEKLIETIETVCPSKVEDKITEMVKIDFLEDDINLKFIIGHYTETVTFSIFGDKDGDSFKLEINGETMNLKNEETYQNVLKISYSPPVAPVSGECDFSYANSNSETTLIEVKKTSKAGQYFFGKVIVHDTTGDEENQMPVIIYAIVRFGSYPLLNAKVYAGIQKPEGEITYLDLNDDGKGDPDITENDGIYSRYFTKFTKEGEYTVTVFLTNGDFATRKGSDENAGYKSCCGSSIISDRNQESIPIRLTQVFKTTFSAKSGRPDDGYKPSRITDLRIYKVDDDGIVLKWTAPGGEADSGAVQSYEIKSFDSPEDAKNNFHNTGQLLNYAFTPKERGEIQEVQISYNSFEQNGLYYIAMKTNNSIKESDISSVVQVYIPNRKTTDAPDNKDGGTDEIKTGKTNPKTIGLIVGLIVGLILLMILIYVVIYFVIVRPRRKKQQKENPIYESSRKTENNVLNPISFVSADTLIKHHNEKVKAKTENKEPPIFREEDFEERNLPPTNESSTSSNDQDQESRHKNARNGQPFAPKSPKRITPV